MKDQIIVFNGGLSMHIDKDLAEKFNLRHGQIVKGDVLCKIAYAQTTLVINRMLNSDDRQTKKCGSVFKRFLEQP